MLHFVYHEIILKQGVIYNTITVSSVISQYVMRNLTLALYLIKINGCKLQNFKDRSRQQYQYYVSFCSYKPNIFYIGQVIWLYYI